MEDQDAERPGKNDLKDLRSVPPASPAGGVGVASAELLGQIPGEMLTPTRRGRPSQNRGRNPRDLRRIHHWKRLPSPAVSACSAFSDSRTVRWPAALTRKYRLRFPPRSAEGSPRLDSR